MSSETEKVVKKINEDLKRSKLGVLVIHGIGEQESGEPLLNATEPLFRWFSHAFGKDNVRVKSTDLKGDVDVPANTTFEVQVNSDFNINKNYSKVKTPPKARYKTCLFAEANWAGAFRKPGYKELVTWALLAIPNVIGTQFARGVARLGTQANHLSRFPGLFLALCAHFISLFIALLIQLTIIALLPLAMLPGFGALVVKFQQVLASIIGDSQVFVSQSIQQNAIISKAQRSLEWLGERCNVIIVVAHSQGAAVGYDLLTSPMNEKQRSKVKLFFTLGSGLGKLNDLRKNSEQGFHRYTGLVFILLTMGILAMLPAMMQELALPMDQKTGDFLIVLAPMFGAVVWNYLLGVMLYRTGEHREKLVHDFPLESIRWVDRYARYDLVPAGPLVEKDTILHNNDMEDDEIERLKRFKTDSRQISNFDSIIRDHTTYWNNEDEFVAEAGHYIASEMGEPYAGGLDKEVACHRRWRLTWRTGLLQFAAGLFFLAIWEFNDQLPQWGAKARETLEAVWRKGPERLFELPHFPGSSTEFYLTGLSVLAIYFLVLSSLFLLFWNLWNQSEIYRNLNQDTDENDWHFTLLVWTVLLLPICVFLLLPGTVNPGLPFGAGSLERNVFWFEWILIAAFGLAAALQVIDMRERDSFNLIGRVVALLPIAIGFSWIPARYLAKHYSGVFLSAGDVDFWTRVTTGCLFFASTALIAVILLVIYVLGNVIGKWLQGLQSQFGEEKGEQSVGIIGAFGLTAAVLAITASMFVPGFYSREALLFTVLAIFAYLAAANTVRREGGDVYTVCVTFLLLLSIGCHGYIRNWWLG